MPQPCVKAVHRVPRVLAARALIHVLSKICFLLFFRGTPIEQLFFKPRSIKGTSGVEFGLEVVEWVGMDGKADEPEAAEAPAAEAAPAGRRRRG